MSERTFRAVVAAVLVAALVLVVLVTAATLYRPPPLPPSPSIATNPAPSPTATLFTGPVFEAPGVVSVGLISRGSSSDTALVLQFLESQDDAIQNAPGSFLVLLADHEGDASTVAFVGEPTVAAPGSLGATVAFAAPNVLIISILASDTLNIEPITITGLGISATPAAAIGPVVAKGSHFTGSLEGGLANDVLPSPGSVIELP